MSDLTGWTPGAPGSAPAAAPAAPPPGSGGGGGGGGSDLTGWTPSGGTPTLTSASAAPTAAPAHHGGGHGGFGGFLRDAANFVNPTNIPHLVAGIGGAALASAHNTVDLAAGDITGNIPQHLRAQPGENFVNYFARVNPLIGGIVKGGQQTGVDVAGGVQGAAGLGQGGGGLLGRGFQHEAAQRWAAQPFNSLLGDAGTLALAAGPVAGALGAAGSAAGATAEGADTAATLAAAEAGVKAGEAVQGLSTSEEAAQAATRAQEAAQAARAAHAAPLARAGAGLTQTAAGAERVGGLAGRAMTAPFAPLRGAVLGGTLPVVGDLPGLADMVRANLAPVPAEPVPGFIGNLAGRIAGVKSGLAGRVADVGQVAEARKYLADGPALQAAVERAQLVQNAGEARAALAGRTPSLLDRALGRVPAADPELEKALQLRTVLGGPQGVARILGPALAAGDEHATPILDAAGRQFMSDAQPISVHAAQLAAGLGSPEEEAALTRAQTIRSEPITARAAEEFAGRGRLGGPLNPEQAGTVPMLSAIARQVAPFEETAAQTGRDAETARLRAEVAHAQAAREVPVARGNTGMAGQEQAAGLLRQARARAEATANEATGAGVRIAQSAEAELMAPADPRLIGSQLAAANETAKAGNAQLGEQFRAESAPAVAAQNAATRARTLLGALPETPAAGAGLLGEEAPRTAEALAAARRAGADPTLLEQTAEEAHYQRHYETAGDQAATAAAAEPSAAAERYVRDTRATIRAAISQDHQTMTGRLDEALAAGGRLGAMANTPEWEDLRQLPPSLLARMRSAGGTLGGLAPDQWAREVAAHLGLPADATVGQVVDEVNRLYDGVRELGKAKMGGAPLVDYLVRDGGPDSEEYYGRLLAGDPRAAARALIDAGQIGHPESEDARAAAFAQAARTGPSPLSTPTAVNRALTETPTRDPVAEARDQLHAELANRAQTAGQHVEGLLASYRAREEPTLTGLEIREQAAGQAATTRAQLAPLAEGVRDRAEANAWRRVGDALNTDAEAKAGRPGYESLSPAEQALYRAHVGADFATAKSARLADARDTVFDTIAGRGRAAGRIEGARGERANVAERAATLAESRAARAQTALTSERAAAQLNPANAPARFRPAIGMAATITKALTDAADAADKVQAGSGDLLRQGADTIPTTLQAFADAGINPQHLIGSLDDAARSYGQGATRTVDLRLPRVAKLASENVKEAGVIPADLPAAVRPELARVSQVVANESAAPFQDRYGTTAGRVAGDTPEGRLMSRAVEQAGYKAWNPRAWTETIPADQVNAATPIIPTALFHAFSEYWSPKPATGAAGLAGTVYDTLIRGGKNLTVALNPSYHAAVILGNTLKAAALGGENPAALIRGLADAVRMLRDDPANQLAVGAGRGSLSAEQADMLQALHGPRQGAGITSRLAAPAWKLSSYIQTVQRLGLTLAHINEGADPAAAVADAARVMGDFGKLAPWEQNTLRRVIPGYDFYKQITKLAVSLPIEHPARIAWLNYLTNAAGPAAQGAPPYFLNPLGMLGGLPSLALPIRGALELGGVKLNMAHPSKTRTLEEPPALAPDGQPLPTSGSPLARGPASVGETGYALGQLFPESRLYDALRSPNIHRYDTGEPRLTKTGPTAYPGGKLGGILYALGLGGTQPAAATPTKAQKAYTKSQTDAAQTYAKRLATYTKTGK